MTRSNILQLSESDARWKGIASILALALLSSVLCLLSDHLPMAAWPLTAVAVLMLAAGTWKALKLTRLEPMPASPSSGNSTEATEDRVDGGIGLTSDTVSNGRPLSGGSRNGDDESEEGEDQLGARERDFRLMLETIPGFVHTMTPTGVSEFFSRQILEFFGRTPGQLSDWSCVTHPDDVPEVARRLQHSLATGKLFDAESRALRADGVYRWFQSRASPLRDQDGRIIRWYHLMIDIDERKRAEEALRASELNYRTIIDSIPGFVHTMTPDGESEFYNKQILNFFGKSYEELKDWTKVTHPDDVLVAFPKLAYSLKTGETYEVDTRGLGSDGAYRWFHSKAQPVRDPSGKIVRWYHLITDIDDRRRAEEALRASEHNFRGMVNSIPGLLCTNTPAGAVELANHTLLEYTGKELDELRDWASMMYPDDLPLVASLWERSVAEGDPFDVEVRVRRADGIYRWFQCRGRPLRDVDGSILRWYNLFTDIEDRKNAEDALRATQARLARATQIATVGELSASIAHEVNQPLAAVVANGHACRTWLSATPPNVQRARLAVESVIRDGTSAAQVVQRIRALFKQAPPNMAPLNMSEVAKDVLFVMRDEARKKRVSLDFDVPVDLPMANADRIQLQQLMANLVRNAIEATETDAERARQVRVTGRLDRDAIVVHVTDNGAGVQDTEAVFEPFFTTKSNGMGMGLVVCRSIVQAHGGRIWVTPNRPFGATFGFTLPLSIAQHGDPRQFES